MKAAETNTEESENKRVGEARKNRERRDKMCSVRCDGKGSIDNKRVWVVGYSKCQCSESIWMVQTGGGS